ncbi:MAG: hypothetical protein OHK0052_26020 [Anaerolineales bacterium]
MRLVMGIWIFCGLLALLSGCVPSESAPAQVPAPTFTAPPTNSPAPAQTPMECESPTVAAYLQAPAQVSVGATFTVTVTLSNQGCGLAGLPQYRLRATPLDTADILLPAIPEPQTHSLGLNAGQSDRAEFRLQAVAPGKIQLDANVSFEFHLGYPGPAFWWSASTTPVVVHILPEQAPQP